MTLIFPESYSTRNYYTVWKYHIHDPGQSPPDVVEFFNDKELTKLNYVSHGNWPGP